MEQDDISQMYDSDEITPEARDALILLHQHFYNDSLLKAGSAFARSNAP